MTLLLVYALVLLLAVLLSALAHRTVLSTAVLFLVAGFVLGDDVTGVVDLGPSDPIVSTLAELALFAILFTDGMRVGLRDLTAAWRLPGRALGWGLPLTLLVTALLAHFVAGWTGPKRCSSVPCLRLRIRCSPRRWWGTRRSPAGCGIC
jgi:Kef-type K+ transport system membrane component KefB